MFFFFFLTDTPTTEIYTYCHPRSLHDALPIGDEAQVYDVVASLVGEVPVNIRQSSPCVQVAVHLVASFVQHHERQFLGVQRIDKRPPIILRSEEHTSELQSLMRNSYDDFFLIQTKRCITHRLKTQA